MKNPAKIPSILCAAVLLAACSKEAVYTRESFSADSPYRLKVEDELAVACESARRSLLGQGYLIDVASTEQVKARKSYRAEGKANTFIEMNVACVPDRVGSTLYATGVLSTYDLKKSSNPASVGLTGLGTISLPIGQSADSLVKIAEETIGDTQFYRRFFAAVEHTLGEMRTRAAVAGEEAPTDEAPAAVEPVPVIVEEQGPEPGPSPAAVTVQPAPGAGEPTVTEASVPAATAATETEPAAVTAVPEPAEVTTVPEPAAYTPTASEPVPATPSATVPVVPDAAGSTSGAAVAAPDAAPPSSTAAPVAVDPQPALPASGPVDPVETEPAHAPPMPMLP